MEDQKKAMDMSSPSTPESPAPVISGEHVVGYFGGLEYTYTNALSSV